MVTIRTDSLANIENSVRMMMSVRRVPLREGNDSLFRAVNEQTLPIR